MSTIAAQILVNKSLRSAEAAHTLALAADSEFTPWGS